MPWVTRHAYQLTVTPPNGGVGQCTARIPTTPCNKNHWETCASWPSSAAVLIQKFARERFGDGGLRMAYHILHIDVFRGGRGCGITT